MEKQPRISIITVVRNDQEHIDATIRSVLDQTYDNIQYIIIDGASTDGTTGKIAGYGNKINVFITEPDQGIYDAMNKGIGIATGEYLLFLNSGDRLYETGTLQKIFSMDPADIYYGETAYYDSQDHYLGIRSEVTTRVLPARLNDRHFLMGMPVAHQSFIIRKEISSQFNTRFNCSADIDWCIQSLKYAKKVVNTGFVISKYLVGGHSHRNRRTCWKERFVILKNHFGPVPAILAQLRIIFRYFYKYLLLGRRY